MSTKDFRFDINSLLKKQNEKFKNKDNYFEGENIEINSNDSSVLQNSIQELTKNIKPKSNKKTFGYYIDVEIDEKLEKLASELKTRKSEVLETILKKVL